VFGDVNVLFNRSLFKTWCIFFLQLQRWAFLSASYPYAKGSNYKPILKFLLGRCQRTSCFGVSITRESGLCWYVAEEPAVSIFITQVNSERIYSPPGSFLVTQEEKKWITSV
jgi:hypothetical protein